jgi:hypothetical protein
MSVFDSQQAQEISFVATASRSVLELYLHSSVHLQHSKNVTLITFQENMFTSTQSDC